MTPLADKRLSGSASTGPNAVPGPASGYRDYRQTILAKAAQVAKIPALPVDVEIALDYTGPAHGTPFDTFTSDSQRENSVREIHRMLASGIVAINPRPGVHAARENGEFIRYRSLLAQATSVDQMPDSMLIHIHAFYPEIVAEMLRHFTGAARSGRFFITTTTESDQARISKIAERRGFANCRVALIKNRGRDIGPLLDHALAVASPGDVICHVHTKKSPDIGGTYGEKWRKQLYGALLGQTAIDAFRDPRLSLLFPDTPRAVGWGKNRAFCEEIAASFGVTLKPHPGPMPVGNMFFARFEVVQAMRAATQAHEWPREPVGYDGTILHAIERMWTAACEHTGHTWAGIHSAYGEDKIAMAADDTLDDSD